MKFRIYSLINSPLVFIMAQQILWFSLKKMEGEGRLRRYKLGRNIQPISHLFFAVPKSVLNKIEKLIKAFLWSQHGQKRIHRVDYSGKNTELITWRERIRGISPLRLFGVNCIHTSRTLWYSEEYLGPFGSKDTHEPSSSFDRSVVQDLA